MRKSILNFGLLCLFLAIEMKAQPKLNIQTAIELNFLTETGKVYQLQVSSDLSSWIDFDLPIFGNGNQLSKLYSARMPERNFYRLTNAIPIPGLVGFYPFNGNAYDFSGYTNHGSLTGVTSATDRFGNTNGAYHFSGGGNSYILIPDSATLTMSNAITLAAWIKTKGGGYAQPRILNKGPTYQLLLTDTGLNPQAGYALQPLSPGVVASSPVSLCVNDWIFLTGTYDGNMMRLYTNGVLAGQVVTSGNIGVNNKPVSIGENFDNDSDYFVGDIDDVRIYNRALSAVEIQQLYVLPY